MITLDTARAIIAGTRAHAGTAGFKPMTVVVLDAGGHVVAVEREDGSSMKRFEIGFGKAHGALSLGHRVPRHHGAAPSSSPTSSPPSPRPSAARWCPVPGGVLVRDADGALLGAVGVTGDTSDNDEAAAVAGIEGAGLTRRDRLRSWRRCRAAGIEAVAAARPGAAPGRRA